MLFAQLNAFISGAAQGGTWGQVRSSQGITEFRAPHPEAPCGPCAPVEPSQAQSHWYAPVLGQDGRVAFHPRPTATHAFTNARPRSGDGSLGHELHLGEARRGVLQQAVVAVTQVEVEERGEVDALVDDRPPRIDRADRSQYHLRREVELVRRLR
jgi:hypothetical protein